MNIDPTQLMHYTSVIAGEFLSALVLAIILFAMLVYREPRKSTICLFATIFVDFLFLVGDAVSFYNLSIKTLPIWVTNISYFISYVFGLLILIPFSLYSKAFIEEKTAVGKWVYRIPVILGVFCFIASVGAIISGSVFGVVNGKMAETGGLPSYISLVQVIVAIYMPIVAFTYRKSIGLKAVMLLGLFGLVPVMLYFLYYDFAGIGTALDLILVYVFLQCDTSVEREKQRKALEALNDELRESNDENLAQLEEIKALNEQLHNNQARLEESAAEQESQLEEITSLNTQLQENQVQLEESYAEQEAQIEEISGLNERMQRQLSLIKSMNKIYFSSFYVDLKADSYIVLNTIQTMRDIITSNSNAQSDFYGMCEKLILSDNIAEAKEFVTLSTLNERMQGKDVLTFDYIGLTSGWSQINLIAGDRDADGNLLTIFVAIRKIHDEKAREEKWQKEITTQYEMINAAGRVYNCIYYIDLQDRTYVEVSSKSSKFAKVGEYIAAKGNAEESLEMFLKHLILPEYEAKLREFCDLNTLDERLLGKTFITCDYEGVVNGYSQGVFIAGDRDEKGKLCHVFWAVRDNNEIKNRELAHARELEKAIDAAEAANKAKTTFLNNMSHDIRTPMNAILGFAKLMEKELDKPELAREHLKKIHYSGEYLLTIINNILDMARIESGRTTVDEELIDIEEAQGGVVAVFEEAAKKKNISLNCSWDIQHRYVYVDYAKCQQVAVNLISNAIKYTPNCGSVTVRVDELPSERQGYTDFCLMVKDTGIGMSKEFQEELFEAFSRERNTTHSKVVGTGLGMAIVKKLVDLMQGTILVDSEPGKGSTFKVRVSLRIAEAPRMYISRQEEAAPLAIDLSGKRILLAEDNELNAEIATCILEDEGFIVEHAEDGIACVDMVNKKAAGHYDVILMDIQMPNLNGYGATEKIRKFADKAKATIPIIAMTANAFDEDKKRALDAGMDGFCTKPIDVEQLNKELVRVLGYHSGITNC